MPEEQQREPQADQVPRENQEEQGGPARRSFSEGGGFGAILTPEGASMLFVAGMIDLVSVIPLVNVISAITGMCVVGLWLLVRGKRPQRAGRKASTQSLKWLKRFGTFGGELIPIISALPLWTLLVYGELKSED